MAQFITCPHFGPEDTAKRMYFLAYQNATTEPGTLNEEQVWGKVTQIGAALNCDKIQERGMHLYMQVSDGGLLIPTPHAPNPLFQMWAREFPTYEALLEAAVDSLHRDTRV